MNARPTGRGNMAARRETAGPAPSQTPVGADSISARFAARQGSAGGINPSPTNHGRPSAKRAKRGPAVISGLCRGRCLHRPAGPVAAQGSAGGLWPSPTNHGERPAKREGHTPPDGRRAGCPHPAAPRGGARFRFLKFPRCGGRERPPYGPGQHGGLPGNHRPCGVTNPCRGGFHIRPVRGGGSARGRDKSLPYKPWRTPGQMAPPPAAAFTAAGGVPFYGVVVTGNVKTVIRRPAALRGPARRCGS